MERLAVLLRVDPPSEYADAQMWLEKQYEAYEGHSDCNTYHSQVAHKSVSGQNPHVTLMWDLHTDRGIKDAVVRFRRAWDIFCSTAKSREVCLHPRDSPEDVFTACNDVEAHASEGWAFGHCATPEYPPMTWMEVTLAQNNIFSELKRAIGAEFGESVSDEFSPHCSICYMPYKDQSFGLPDAQKLVEKYPQMVSSESIYRGVEMLLIKTGINAEEIGWPTEILDRIELHVQQPA